MGSAQREVFVVSCFFFAEKKSLVGAASGDFGEDRATT